MLFNLICKHYYVKKNPKRDETTNFKKDTKITVGFFFSLEGETFALVWKKPKNLKISLFISINQYSVYFPAAGIDGWTVKGFRWLDVSLNRQLVELYFVVVDFYFFFVPPASSLFIPINCQFSLFHFHFFIFFVTSPLSIRLSIIILAFGSTFFFIF